jgi:hypothetical protein
MNKKDERAMSDIGNRMRLHLRLKRDQPGLFPLPADHEWLHTPLCQSGLYFGGKRNCAIRLRVGTQIFE